MNNPIQRWTLLGTSTNPWGVRHFMLVCRDTQVGEGDYEEVLRALRREYDAVECGELLGPYSVHRFVQVGDVRLGIILESPEWIDIYAVDNRQEAAAEAIVARLVNALNLYEP